ncbi:hypothetical protein D3C85_934010 [compost metagenome]
MQRTVDAHTNPDVRTLIFNVNITRVQAISLVDKIFEHAIAPDRVQCFTHLCNRFTVTLFGNLNIIVDHFFWRVKTIHECPERTLANQKELNITPSIMVLLLHLTNKRLRRLTCYPKTVRVRFITGNKRHKPALVHVLNIKHFIGKWQRRFKLARVEIL